MRDAIDEALRDDEVKHRLQSAIDNIKYFCQEVGRIHQQGKNSALTIYHTTDLTIGHTRIDPTILIKNYYL